MSRSIRVRPDLVQRVKLAVKHNGFLRQQDLVEEVGLASSTVRNFLNGKLVDYATFVELCKRLNLEWRDFADLGEITELNRESEEAVIARYSTSGTEKNTPDDLDLAEREEVISKPNIQIEENNTDQIEERIFRATEQLNRRGFSALVGIQALEEIAKDSSRYHWKIMEVLAAFVRNAPQRKEEARIPDDLQAALTVIGRRDSKKDPSAQKWTLNLSNTDIRGAILTEANLEGANLFAANLQEAKLFEANLEKAYLRQAKLQDAVLTLARLREATLVEANLEGAFLGQAKLPGSDLREANLKRTNLGGANLYKAVLFQANLERANLKGAILQEANFREAKLQRADFGNANLKYANLNEADLQEVNLSGVNIQGADFSGAKKLTSEQIKLAYGNNTTILPQNVERPAHWM